MAAIYQAVYRRASSLFCRSHSTYVRKMRYLNELKEDDNLCRQAQTSGTFYLFHNLSPFLQKVGKKYLVPQLGAAEMKRTLEKFKETEQWIEKSVLIGCSDEHVPRFALDLGPLEKSVIESELEGSFTDLRKALFIVDEKDSPLLASAQSLLRWHDSHQYCSKTGQPTQKNVAGSKRVCHASGITYYPQMSPVVITLVSDGTRCLLARQPSFPQGMFTALSGFCDVGENVEETVRREVAEEVGLEVESLWYSASQHWPFPSSCLMIACHVLVRAQQAETIVWRASDPLQMLFSIGFLYSDEQISKSSLSSVAMCQILHRPLYKYKPMAKHPDVFPLDFAEEIRMNSLELEEARWFGLEEIVEGLKREPRSSKQEDGSFLPWFPPKQAIAHQLICEWVKCQTSWLA